MWMLVLVAIVVTAVVIMHEDARQHRRLRRQAMDAKMGGTNE